MPGVVLAARHQHQAGVADDVAGGVDRDRETPRRDHRSVHVAGPELGQIPGRHRLVAGDVAEGLEGHGVHARDEIRAAPRAS